MKDTSLDRPWAKLCQILSFAYCDGAILVPDDLPIGIGRLVEQDTAHGEGFLAEDTVNQLPDRFRNGQCAHGWNV